MKTLHFTGTITTLEPFTVSIAKQGGLPKFNGLAYIPSSTINGAIRNACLDYLISQANKNDINYLHTLETYYSTSQGYILNNEIKEAIDKAKTSTPIDKDDDIRAVNPALSLFGRWKLDGKFGIGNAYTSHGNQCRKVEQGFRSQIFERNPQLFTSLPTSEAERYYKLIENQSSAASKVGELKKKQTALLKEARKTADEEGKAVLYQQANAIDAEIKLAKDASDEGKETILRPIDDVEVIEAGVALSHRMALRQVTDEEIGLALLSWAQFSLNPQLGGKARHNFGAIHAHWDVSVSNEDTFGRDPVGSVTIDDNGFHIEGDMLTSAIRAFKAGEFNYSRIA